jgi:hypothetical protein
MKAAVAMVMQLDEEMPIQKNFEDWADTLENIISVIARGDYCDYKFEI